MDSELVPIGEAARFLGVTPTTLRRWEKSGRLLPLRTPSGHRRYALAQLTDTLGGSDAERALGWVSESEGREPDPSVYCLTPTVFHDRLLRAEREMARMRGMEERYSLITAAAGEIGNNSFDHNIGNWPDIPGIFFAFDRDRRSIVLADRGQGILTTLRQVRPTLGNHREALAVAFTEILSGRAPEARGNGLKLVRKTATLAGLGVTFQTGNARLRLDPGSPDFRIKDTGLAIRGCLAILTF